MKLGPVSIPIVPPPFKETPGPGRSGFSGSVFHGAREAEYDRFILSPSQYALVVYAALIGLKRMSEKSLEMFNQDGSTVEMIGAEHSPGMEVMTGSLGQGISQAAGIAFGRRLKKETGRVWVFMSDGEFQIGQTWEAIQTMSFYRLDSVGIYVDVNGQQCDGKTATVMNVEPLDKRLEAFGARVFRVNGHDSSALARPAGLKPDGRPLVVLADTDPCRDIDLLKKKAPKLHYIRFADDTEKRSYQNCLKQMETQDR